MLPEPNESEPKEVWMEFARGLNSKLNRLVGVFQTAERIGAPTDEPEGSRYISITDSLVKNLIKDCGNYEEGK